jgi:hypothetical protein
MTGKLDMRVWQALLRRLGVGQDPFVKVGVLQSHGAGARHADSEATVVEVAAIHEFGDGPIPERSFIRRVLHEKEREILELQAKLTAQVIEGRLTTERALHLVGAFVAAEIKKRVAGGERIPPPLQPATVKAKGSSRPLVDKGQLVGSVAWEVSR